eukprot:CAMPEP_0197542028 /NCGR_PEP_ID=MMETSP1318-20131121/67486_1 /TAXON_ID=552666 /ORGANISM="Partenskyella glossopodia, Strain RCC365" /LENGTH=301 /DNA_ID=CAMNT_0043101265 /DNA_START=1343 /DNA_END=2248 /DNA_ORIENTATION=-
MTSTFANNQLHHQDRRYYDGNAGACAIVCHVDGQNVTAAWVGDCRAILGKRTNFSMFTGQLAADELTKDHQIDCNPTEKERLIREHPGEVDIVARNRVKGRLEPTRAFGDGKYKSLEFFKQFPRLVNRYSKTGWTPPYVTAEPEISRRNISYGDEFLVLACDGLFQDLSSQQVVDGVVEFMSTPEHQRNGHNAATWLTQKALEQPAKHHARDLERHYGTKMEINDVMKQLVTLPQGRSRRRLHDDITIQVIFFDHNASFPGQTPSMEAIREPSILAKYRSLPTRPAVSKVPSTIPPPMSKM